MPFDGQNLEGARQAILSAFSWTKRDFDFAIPVKKGSRATAARRVQELLCANGVNLTIDNDYGGATHDAVAELQRSEGLPATGEVDASTRLVLLKPFLHAADPRGPAGADFKQMLNATIERHRKAHAVEIGGDNCGPWVRLYCQGSDGKQFLWCAGFVSFLLHQAAHASNTKPPFIYTLSCDNLAGDAKAKKQFIPGNNGRPNLPSPAIFLLRQTPTDWFHTGLVTSFDADSYGTMEGNSNEGGSSNGFEATARRRGYKGKDFIRLFAT
jgi:Putative peptidoglycan binding domain